ncbi:MAG TPA: hypothetical protein IGS53_21600 [Leptolyngbyaceae cyanobacterium M33_DOE_097]|uniref:Uncharacterized protein n=1 Tax=Oscillatoriales cyanobacterium SpSt-418 TaxID=2282169 RepID=A0A7C3PG78_9CYAN|nr:hypothetical protein [Leptolyngbyaceae cyanobacterium M33_DOE_097]
MPHYYALELYTPESPVSTSSETLPWSNEARKRLDDAGLVINHSLLVGEILGENINPAIELLDEINRANRLFEESYENAESSSAILYEEDINLLYEIFSKILEHLSAAISHTGQPVGIGGERLLASELVGNDANGVLYLHSRHVELLTLKMKLEELCDFLKFATAQNLLVKIEI